MDEPTVRFLAGEGVRMEARGHRLHIMVCPDCEGKAKAIGLGGREMPCQCAIDTKKEIDRCAATIHAAITKAHKEMGDAV